MPRRGKGSSAGALALAGLCAWTAPAAAPAAGQAERPRVVSSFQAEPGAGYPFRENMYRALQLPDGRIIALSIARDKDRRQTMQGRYSTDEGHTWSAPQNLFPYPRDAGGFGLFDALVDRDGEIQIAVLGDGNSGALFPPPPGGRATYDVLEIWYVRSKDRRKAWETPKRIRPGMATDLLSFIQLRNGRLVLPISFPNKRTWAQRGEGFLQFTYVGPYSCSSMYSDDRGRTWHASPDVLSVETPDLGTYGADEPVVIQRQDGSVWMLMRTQRGRFYESSSPDGARWSPPRPSRLISSDSPAGLIRLKDGSLLLFANACSRYPYAYGGRHVLHAAVSRDEGRTWQGFRELARDPHRDQPPPSHSDYGIAYTFPTVTASGRVLFSNWVEQGATRRFRLFDPAWLQETRQECDFANGLQDWSVFGSKGVELIPDPGRREAKVLALRKADEGWPAGAVWNFPAGARGRLRLQVLLRSGFGGALLGLTDHFSVPWDREDEFHNVVNLPIAPSGELLPGVKLAPDRWYQLEFAWDTPRRRCRLLLDDRPVGTLEDGRKADGVNYLRLRSTAEHVDQGLLLRAVRADVSAGGPR